MNQTTTKFNERGDVSIESLCQESAKDGVCRRLFADRYLPNTKSGEFHKHQIIHQQSGIIRLVVSSYHSSGKGFDYDNDSLRDDEVLADFVASDVYNNLTKSQREQVCHLVNFYCRMTARHKEEDLSGQKLNYRRIYPPATAADVERRYINGNSSIRRCLPKPGVKKLKNHAYTSIMECIQELFHSGTPMSLMTLNDLFEPKLAFPGRITSITETKRARRVMMISLQRSLGVQGGAVDIDSKEEMEAFCVHTKRALWELGIEWDDVRFVMGIRWTDGITTCHVKKNSCVWAGSLTLAPDMKSWNSRHNTFPLVIGREKDSEDKTISVDHTEVIDKINAEINEITSNPPTPVFSASHGALFRVVFGEYAYFGDQPERRKMTGTAAGQSNYHLRFRHRAHHKLIFDRMVPCASCFASLRNEIEPSGCSECCCWDALDKGPVRAKLETSPAKEYPPREKLVNPFLDEPYLTETGKLAPMELSYERLRASFRFAYKQFTEGEWTEAQTKTFLNTECMNTSVIDDLLSRGKKSVLLKTKHRYKPEERKKIEQEFEDAPDLFSDPVLNSHWTSGDSMKMFVDSPMHLLFLGIVKTVLKSITEWTKQQRLFKDFCQKAKEYNDRLHELKLDWLPYQEFKDGSYTGWVSENYLAFSRIMKWFFQEIRELVRDSDEEGMSLPTKAPCRLWKRCHFVYFLTSRGLKVKKKENLKSLRPRVQQLFKRPGGPPPVKKNRAGVYEPSQVERVLIALENMLDSLMAPDVIPVESAKEASLRIKIFITEFNILDDQIKSEDKQKAVLSCPNILTLLNLPAMLEEFGPIRFLWEGNVHGESFLRLIKPYLRFGLRDNFAYNAMVHCMEDAAYQLAYQKAKIPIGMEALVPCPSSVVVSDWSTFFAVRRRDFKRYDSLGSVEIILSTRGILSVLVVQRMVNGKSSTLMLAALAKSGSMDELSVHEIVQAEGAPSQQFFGDSYFRWLTGSNDSIAVSRLHEYLSFEDVVITFGTLLPRVKTGSIPGHCLVCHDRYRLR